LYAAEATVIIAFFSLFASIPFFVTAALGKATLFGWLYVLLELVCVATVLGFALKLLGWHRQLARKYSKLIEMEKKIGVN
jgi:hypothetical protein